MPLRQGQRLEDHGLRRGLLLLRLKNAGLML